MKFDGEWNGPNTFHIILVSCCDFHVTLVLFTNLPRIIHDYDFSFGFVYQLLYYTVVEIFQW